jgi:hypothetical protein
VGAAVPVPVLVGVVLVGFAVLVLVHADTVGIDARNAYALADEA